MQKILVWDFLGTMYSFANLRLAINKACHYDDNDDDVSPNAAGYHEASFSPFSFWFASSMRDFMAASTSNKYIPLRDVMQSALGRVGILDTDAIMINMKHLDLSDGLVYYIY